MRPVDLVAKPLLVSNSFKLINTSWYRSTGEVLQIINFQHSPWSNMYYLNTAIDFCNQSLKELGRVLPKEYQCPIRWRSEHIPEAEKFVFALDYEVDYDESIRNTAIISLLEYWISFFEGIKTQAAVLEKIINGTIDRNTIYYSFLKEHNLQ